MMIYGLDHAANLTNASLVGHPSGLTPHSCAILLAVILAFLFLIAAMILYQVRRVSVESARM